MYKKLLKWEYIICIQFFSVYSERHFMKKIKGFTLAEALLTMTILGVVAAFLIPTENMQTEQEGRQWLLTFQTP